MYLDIFLIVVMLISGLLAMVRGFMREILSIAAWAAAAATTLYFYARLLPTAKQYFNNDLVAAGITIGGLFLGTLIIVSILTVRLSDKILDSRIGALDRTLGFLFGLARGLIIVVVAFVFFDWLVPQKSQPEAVRNARSRVVLQGTGDWLKSLLPEDPEDTILKKFKRPKGDEEAPEAPADRRSDLAPKAGGERAEMAGYDRGERRGMQQLIQSRTAGSR
jgi:membrane protein required for colicin V production